MGVSKISGPAAGMFDEPQQTVDDELFAPSISPDEARMQILETRLNEMFDFLVFAKLVNSNNRRLLTINEIHRGDWERWKNDNG
jgi:hypothetical protein